MAENQPITRLLSAASQVEPRFPFGKNWTNFLAHLTPERVECATDELKKLVGDLRGKTFLDIGCGSGIHSLAALRLGASRVFSFDYDRDSVAAAKELRRRAGIEAGWHMEQGSVLDEAYMRSLGEFDVVYAWGCLMHTGQMWRAMELAAMPCKELLIVGIYNDAGLSSRTWQKSKRTYSRFPVLRPAILAGTFVATWGKMAAYQTLRLRPLQPFRKWREYSKSRGMSAWHDLVDWAGGYPFEFAKPEDVTTFYASRGFTQQCQRIAGGRAINEFVFLRRLI